MSCIVYDELCCACVFYFTSEASCQFTRPPIIHVAPTELGQKYRGALLSSVNEAGDPMYPGIRLS